MILLGVDPGLLFSGYAILVRDGKKVSLLQADFLKLPAQKTVAHRVHLFHDFFTALCQQHNVTDIALETPFLGKNAQNFLKLGYLRGILYLIAEQRIAQLHELTPCQIKQSLTSYGTAPKEQVARVVMKLFPNLPPPTRFDVTDAVALSLSVAWKSSLNQKVV
jgi:crossover junction endodeoxyribonuclease RuvC